MGSLAGRQRVETERANYTEIHFQVENAVLRIGVKNRPITEP